MSDSNPRIDRELAEAALTKELADESIAPWDDILTPAGRAGLRDILEEVLATHPIATRQIAELLPPPHVDASGEVPTDESIGTPDRPATSGNRGGGAQ